MCPKKHPESILVTSLMTIACLVKMAGCWCYSCLWTMTLPQSINTQKKELGQYPAILTSRLVNNPHYIAYLKKTV